MAPSDKVAIGALGNPSRQRSTKQFSWMFFDFSIFSTHVPLTLKQRPKNLPQGRVSFFCSATARNSSSWGLNRISGTVAGTGHGQLFNSPGGVIDPLKKLRTLASDFRFPKLGLMIDLEVYAIMQYI